ncbi:MAG: primosomal protein N', partial [Chloroflexi bacterium]|nr:primosomal protein N' [Chloroflexota bacterium]
MASLRRKGIIVGRTERIRGPGCIEAPLAREPHLKLNPDQQKALDAILKTLHSRDHRTVLIHGVTGSGKTEVYIQAIQEVIRFGRQAIVLVPEISLTPQTVRRFRSRFDRVAVLHSHMTDVERHAHWREIAEGRVQVVVGTRSAVFAPTPNLGMIILDEEHESSFKQAVALRYHARDVAIKRAQLLKIPVVLGSATPSLETWHNCRVHDHYESIHLTCRVAGLDMPEVEVVDMRYEEHARHGAHLLARLLEKRLGDTLAKGEQAVLMLNRRGYAQVLYCPKCKNRVLCHNCKAGMVFHQLTGEAVCH